MACGLFYGEPGCDDRWFAEPKAVGSVGYIATKMVVRVIAPCLDAARLHRSVSGARLFHRHCSTSTRGQQALSCGFAAVHRIYGIQYGRISTFAFDETSAKWSCL